MKFYILLLMVGALFGCGKQTEPTIFYLVRHGQTDWNVQKKLQGQSDIPLNDTGRREAAQLSETFHEIDVDVCFTSDLQRAIETAQILKAGRSFPIEIDPRFRERNFGPWEGRFSSEFLAHIEQGEPLLNVETDEEMRERVFSILHEIADHHQGTTVLIVTHGGVIRTLLTQLLAVDGPLPFDIQVRNLATVRLAVSNGRCEILDMQGIKIQNEAL